MTCFSHFRGDIFFESLGSDGIPKSVIFPEFPFSLSDRRDFFCIAIPL